MPTRKPRPAAPKAAKEIVGKTVDAKPLVQAVDLLLQKDALPKPATGA